MRRRPLVARGRGAAYESERCGLHLWDGKEVESTEWMQPGGRWREVLWSRLDVGRLLLEASSIGYPFSHF